MAEQTVQAVARVTHQCTIGRPVSVSGVGLHTGLAATLTFQPAAADTGVVFVRVDLPDRPRVRAHASALLASAHAPRRTAVANGRAEVHTIEHAMAALWGLGIDNVQMDITGEELPGLDGSAQPFVTALQSAGIVAQDSPRRVFAVKEPIWLDSDDAAIAVLPHTDFRVSYTLSYDHPLLKAQFVSFHANGTETFEHLAPARTFCLEQEAEELQKRGLGKGATYDNTLVVGNGGVIRNRLRFEDEFVRHKILDLLGDFYLLGEHLKAHVIALKSGHALNLRVVEKLYAAMERAKSSAIRSAAPHVFPGPTLDITMIQRILPHRYPFLLVDRIVELVEDRRAVGIKNVTANEQFFQGHFPGRPVMPGVLLIEAMAQVGGVLILNKQENFGKYVYFMSADKVKFRQAVVPGDQLVLTAEVERFRGKMGFVQTTATVEGKVVAEAQLGFALVEG